MRVGVLQASIGAPAKSTLTAGLQKCHVCASTISGFRWPSWANRA